MKLVRPSAWSLDSKSIKVTIFTITITKDNLQLFKNSLVIRIWMDSTVLEQPDKLVICQVWDAQKLKITRQFNNPKCTPQERARTNQEKGSPIIKRLTHVVEGLRLLSDRGKPHLLFHNHNELPIIHNFKYCLDIQINAKYMPVICEAVARTQALCSTKSTKINHR